MSTTEPTEDPTCAVKPRRERRKHRDMSWYPDCGLTRERIPWDENPAIVATEYGNALVNANLDCEVPFLFVREGSQPQLVYVGRDEKTFRIVSRPLNAAVLRSMLHEVADLGRMVETGWKSISPYSRDGWPSSVVEMLLTNLATDPDIPVLRMLVTSPVLTEDGWLEETAYDPASGILSKVRADDWRPVTDILGNETLTATAMVRDMFRDTKIADPSGLSMLVGSMVSLVARPLFKNVPMIVHSSGDFGTGKTATATVIGTVCLSPGEWTLVSCADFDGKPAEMEKRISDALTGLYRYIVLDDPKEGIQFNHTDLATLLTAPWCDIRTFGKLGGPNSKTRVYANQSIAMCANNPDIHSRFASRSEDLGYDTPLADNRKIQWERKNYEAFITENRRDYNWAIRTLVNEAHRILSTPGGRALWEARLDVIVEEVGARGNFREWYLYTAVVSDLLGVSLKEHLSTRVEYEAPSDGEAGRRAWIVQRLISLGATNHAAAVTAGQLVPTDEERKVAEAAGVFEGLEMTCPWGTSEGVSAYLRLHASGKSGDDAEGEPWKIQRSGKKVQKRATWMAIPAKKS